MSYVLHELIIDCNKKILQSNNYNVINSYKVINSITITKFVLIRLLINFFLQNYESVSSSSGSNGFPSRSFKPCCSYMDVSKLVCELKERLETVFNQEINETFKKGKITKVYFTGRIFIVPMMK